MRILDWTINVDVHVKSPTKWRIHANVPNEWRWRKFPSWNVLLYFIFLHFFHSFFLFRLFLVHCAGYLMIKKPFLTPAKPFSTIIVNQRMLKLLIKVFCHRLWKSRHCYGQRQGFPFHWNPIESFWGGTAIAQVTLQHHSNIYYVLVDAHSENHILQIKSNASDHDMNQWILEFQWGKTPMST